MPAGLILEFEGRSRRDYESVNRVLGIDMETGQGDWPQGLLYHAAGDGPDRLIVFEIWESQEVQQRFLDGRLGPALQEGGISDPPTRVQWIDLLAHHDVAALTAA